MKNLYKQEDIFKVPELAHAIGQKLNDVESTKAFSPTAAAMSGRIVQPETFCDHIPLPFGKSLYRNGDEGSEGTVIRRGETLIFSAKGCALLATSGVDRNGEPFVIGAHAGRGSQIDCHYLKFGRPAPLREFRSVVLAMAHETRLLGADLKKMTLTILFSISAEELIHELDHENEDIREGNRQMRNFLRAYEEPVSYQRGNNLHIDIAELAAADAILPCAGFGGTEIVERIPTGTSFSTTRHTNTSIRSKSNLVVLHCTG